MDRYPYAEVYNNINEIIDKSKSRLRMTICVSKISCEVRSLNTAREGNRQDYLPNHNEINAVKSIVSVK